MRNIVQPGFLLALFLNRNPLSDTNEMGEAERDIEQVEEINFNDGEFFRCLVSVWEKSGQSHHPNNNNDKKYA